MRVDELHLKKSFWNLVCLVGRRRIRIWEIWFSLLEEWGAVWGREWLFAQTCGLEPVRAVWEPPLISGRNQGRGECEGPTTTFKLSWEAGAAQTSSPSWQRLGLAGKFALLDQASAQSMTGSGPACRVGSNESVVTSLIHRALHLPLGATSLTFFLQIQILKRIQIQIAVVTHGLDWKGPGGELAN